MKRWERKKWDSLSIMKRGRTGGKGGKEWPEVKSMAEGHDWVCGHAAAVVYVMSVAPITTKDHVEVWSGLLPGTMLMSKGCTALSLPLTVVLERAGPVSCLDSTLELVLVA